MRPSTVWAVSAGIGRLVLADDTREVLDLLDRLPEVDRSRVLLMPQAVTRDDLQAKSLWLAEECKRLGLRYGPREKIFDAVIDKVEVKPLGECSPREVEKDNPEIKRADDMANFLGQLYNREVTEENTVTVIHFSEIHS